MATSGRKKPTPKKTSTSAYKPSTYSGSGNRSGVPRKKASTEAYDTFYVSPLRPAFKDTPKWTWQSGGREQYPLKTETKPTAPIPRMKRKWESDGKTFDI